MKRVSLTVALIAALTYVHSAPQFISFKEGRLGVNFGGYQAGVGLGGLLGGGAGGGLFAEAGTPHGQAARAGLGGVVDGSGQSSGGLYAGATAGGDVKASAGLAGGVAAEKAAGSGYASAQAGENAASAGLGGGASGGFSSGFTFSGAKSFGGSTGVIKETEVQPVEFVETVRTVPKKVHHEYNFEAVNEIKPVAPVVKTVHVNVQAQPEIPPPVVIKEVYVPPPVIEKHVVHTYRPRHKAAAYLGGYIGGGANPAPVVYQTVAAPAFQKRIDVNAESVANADVDAQIQGGGGGQVGYTKTVNVQRNPQFFADIFNIPIQTLRAVGNFLGNAAGSTSVSVQKSGSVYAG